MRSIVAAMLMLGLAMAAIAAAGQEEKIFPFNYRLVELDNGFKAYLIKAGAPGQIAYVTVVRTGSRDEWEPGKSGFAHFFEHMMFRGTEKYPVYDEVISEMGASENANTSNDRTVYYVIGSSEYLEKIMDLESDRFMNLKYSEPGFRTEAGAVLGEYSQGKFSPFRFLDERVRNLAYDKHTYKHTTIGFEKDIRAMPEGYEYSISFHQRYYRPENCVLVLAGDFDLDNAEELVHSYYSDWVPGYVAPQIEPEPEQTAPRESTVEYPGKTKPILTVNYKGPAWSATDKIAVATEVLGQVAFGPNSEIYRKLVIQEQKLQFLMGDFGLQRDPTLLSISCMLNDPNELELIKGEIADAVQKFSNDLCDSKMLEDTKSRMKYGFLMRLETAQNIAFALLEYVINTGGIEALEDFYKTLASVTAEDVRAAAQKYLVENSRTTVTMVQAEGR